MFYKNYFWLSILFLIDFERERERVSKHEQGEGQREKQTTH